MEIEIHQRENNEDTESHLQENISKYETDAVFLLRLMLSGERLTRQRVAELKIDGRRLGDLFISGKCEKAWKVNEKGKRMYVEYYITIPKPPTKSELITKVAKVINLMQSIPNGYVQKDLF